MTDTLFEVAPPPPAMEYTDAYFTPPDAIEAHEAWGANCGPCALAAMLGVPVADVRQHFPGITERGGWCNPTQMRAALTSAGRRFTVVHQPGRCDPRVPAAMVLVQFTGPWTAADANPRWAYRHTHWIAVRSGHGGRQWVYDVNADGWTTLADWGRVTAAELVRLTPRATGSTVRLALNVEGLW